MIVPKELVRAVDEVDVQRRPPPPYYPSASRPGAATLDAMADADIIRLQLRPVRQALIELHKGLIDAEREQYEQSHGRVPPAELLQLLLSDPQFAWLRSISELIVRIDEMSEADEPPTRQQADEVLGTVRRLLTQTDTRAEFTRRYADTLQRQPALVVVHGRVMRALDAGRSPIE